MRSSLVQFLMTAAAACLACSDDSFAPAVNNIAGTYTATTFRTTSSAVTTDQLAAGSSFTITLSVNGTTTGRLLVPGGAEDGGDLDADMAGTWTLEGSTVRFAQAVDTFVRDMPFTASPNRLVGDALFGGTRIEFTLTK